MSLVEIACCDSQDEALRRQTLLRSAACMHACATVVRYLMVDYRMARGKSFPCHFLSSLLTRGSFDYLMGSVLSVLRGSNPPIPLVELLTCVPLN
jgi:hypothetical protein